MKVYLDFHRWHSSCRCSKDPSCHSILCRLQLLEVVSIPLCLTFDLLFLVRDPLICKRLSCLHFLPHFSLHNGVDNGCALHLWELHVWIFSKDSLCLLLLSLWQWHYRTCVSSKMVSSDTLLPRNNIFSCRTGKVVCMSFTYWYAAFQSSIFSLLKLCSNDDTIFSSIFLV